MISLLSSCLCRIMNLYKAAPFRACIALGLYIWLVLSFSQVCRGFFASTTQTFWHFSAIWLQLRHPLDHYVSNISPTEFLSSPESVRSDEYVKLTLNIQKEKWKCLKYHKCQCCTDAALIVSGGPRRSCTWWSCSSTICSTTFRKSEIIGTSLHCESVNSSPQSHW